MRGIESWLRDSLSLPPRDSCDFAAGGLFIDSVVPASFVPLVCSPKNASFRVHGFISVSLSLKGDEGFVLEKNGEKRSEEEVEAILVEEKKVGVRGAGAGAINTSKHLWAGAVAAMVSRY